MSSELDAHAAPGRLARSQAPTRAGAHVAGLANYWLLLAVSLGVSCIDVLPGLNKFWWPWDEGTLGEMAERVLAGQLPHREFVDVYTGGLTFYDAGVFWLFGTDLLWLRVAMVPFFLAFIAATFYIATRLVSPMWAAVVAITAAVWTVPWYPAAMPSWYILFFTVIGVAFLSRWLESRQSRWLWLAGACGGLAITVKIVGVYYVLAVVLFFAFRSQLARIDWKGERRRLELTGSAGVILVALLSLAVVFTIVAPLLTPAVFVAFLVPVGAVVVAVSVSELTGLRRGRSRFWRTVVVEIGPFVGGVLIPLLIFSIPYLVTGTLGKVIYQVVVSPHSRLHYATSPPLAVPRLISAVPLTLLLLLLPVLPSRLRKVVTVVVAGAIAVAAVLPSLREADMYFVTPLREFLPVLVVAASVAIVRISRRHVDSARFELFTLLTFALAFMALVQFPFAATGYFLYIVPFLLLTAVAFVSTLELTRYRLFGIVLVAYLVSGALNLNTGLILAWRNATRSTRQIAIVDPHRARLYVDVPDVDTYRQVVALLHEHAKGGVTIATPDAPEIYYLANLRNPTPMIFDFLTPEPERDQVILDAIVKPQITAVVVNLLPQFSPGLDKDVLGRLDYLFPDHQLVGHFDVRWRT